MPQFVSNIVPNELVLHLTSTAALAQYQPVQATGAPAAAGGNAVGFTWTAAEAAGQPVPVVVLGPALAVAGAAITAGSLVQVHSTPTQVVTKAAGAAIGRALTAAAAAGDLVEVLTIPN